MLNFNSLYSRRLWALRCVTLSWLIGWYLKVSFFADFLFAYSSRFQIHYDFFPAVFLNPTVCQVAFLIPIVLFFILLRRSSGLFKIAGFIQCLCSVVMALHINTYNDATFIVSFWVGLWCLWFAYHMEKEDIDIDRQAIVLAKMVFGMVFLGGVVGKFTPEYWNGSVLHQIFFVQEPFVILHFIKSKLDPDQLKICAVWISRGIIFTEVILSMAPFWPTRIFAFTAPLILSGFILFRTYYILSVLLALMGLMWGCLILSSKVKESSGAETLT